MSIIDITELIKITQLAHERTAQSSVRHGNIATGYRFAFQTLRDAITKKDVDVDKILEELKASAAYHQGQQDLCLHKIAAFDEVVIKANVFLHQAQKEAGWEMPPALEIEEVENPILGTQAHKAIVAEYGPERHLKGVYTVWKKTIGVSLSECAVWYEAEVTRQK